LTLVSVAHDHETPAVSSVRRNLTICGRNCGIANAAAAIADFERGLAEVAEVRHAERLFGDPDYLVRVATADIAAYQSLRDEKLATLPGVQRLTSTIVMKRVVDERPFPA
jgi:DNA-binding Lrp family transcriptional regulator